MSEALEVIRGAGSDWEDAMNLVTQTAPAVGISFADLLRYNESEAMKWRAWLDTQPPERLDVPFGNAAKRMGNVREMIWHIFITEWVYACVLNREPYDGWNEFKRETVADLFEIGERGRAGLRKYLATVTDADMESSVTLSAAGFTVSGSARKFLTHAFVHSLRHWAQLATVLRQHGHETNWAHDFVLSDVIA
jgi:uncharacterized damage-inducible protein DinB